jgi:hypothetical protein
MSSSDNISNSNNLVEDKEFNDIDIWETSEGRMKAISYIFRKYLNSTNNEINLTKKNLDGSISLFENILLYDNNFQKFAEDNYRVTFEYYEEEDELHIIKF